MSGYFQLRTGNNGSFMFNLKAGNNETILTSESYSTKASALAGIESVRQNSIVEASFVRKMAKDGSPFFVLTSRANGQTLGKSEMYSSPSAMDNGISSVQKTAPAAPVKEA